MLSASTLPDCPPNHEAALPATAGGAAPGASAALAGGDGDADYGPPPATT